MASPLGPLNAQVLGQTGKSSYSDDERLLGLTHTPMTRTYNAAVFKHDTLSNDQHKLVIHVGAGESNSFVVFDYFSYECVQLSLFCGLELTPDFNQLHRP
jgi:hypothetical protein